MEGGGAGVGRGLGAGAADAGVGDVGGGLGGRGGAGGSGGPGGGGRAGICPIFVRKWLSRLGIGLEAGDGVAPGLEAGEATGIEQQVDDDAEVLDGIRHAVAGNVEGMHTLHEQGAGPVGEEPFTEARVVAPVIVSRGTDGGGLANAGHGLPTGLSDEHVAQAALGAGGTEGNCWLHRDHLGEGEMLPVVLKDRWAPFRGGKS